MRGASQGILLSLTLIASARAEAQEAPPEDAFDSKGHFVVATERLFGYVHVAQTQNSSDPAAASMATTTTNAYSLLGTSLNTFASIFTFPRVGFDTFVAAGISLGAAATYFHVSSDNNADFPGSPGNLSTTRLSGYLFAPRVGYAVRVGRTTWVWPRAGITYASFSTSTSFSSVSAPTTGTSTGSTSLTALTVEVPVAIGLGPQVVILIGPTIDISLSGTIKSGGSSSSPNPGASSSANESDVGLQAGVALSF